VGVALQESVYKYKLTSTKIAYKSETSIKNLREKNPDRSGPILLNPLEGETYHFWCPVLLRKRVSM
jgi:hypothetical protein